jgi:long-chain acyl-CoA synthetase
MANEWRLIYNPNADTADLVALPTAVAEGKIAGRYMMAAKAASETVIIQHVKKRGVVVGSEVFVDRAEAEKTGVEVVVQPRAGRGALKPAGTIPLQELMLKAKDDFETETVAGDETACLIYTSGTTGKPKGVILTHKNFITECELTEQVIKTTPEDRFATLVPFFHIYGLTCGLVVSVYRGLSSVLIPQYTPRQFLKSMAENKITVVIAIPTQYFHLLMAARRQPPSPRPNLRYCVSGAAALPVNIIENFKEVFGVTIIEGYGMTETTAAVALNPPEKIKPGSIGLPLAGIELTVVDDQGKRLETGKAGEIIIKGAVLFKGYYNLPQDTAQALKNGWLYTGDIGYRDEDGYFFITDRKKDIIIKGGFNISPKEVEDLLANHPKIKEAAVVGFKEKEGREEGIKAYVVLEDGSVATVEEILEYCRKSLAPHKTPDYVEFKDDLPKSATGKVLRKELKPGHKDERLIEKEEQ